MGVRLRQIALVGQDIDWSVATLCAAFDTYVAFRDPGIVPQFVRCCVTHPPCSVPVPVLIHARGTARTGRHVQRPFGVRGLFS